MHRQEILEKAIECVTRDRNATHGEPEDNFKVIAEFWDSYLTAKGKRGPVTITSADTAAMMILMKVSRLVTSPECVDHWIDIAGYAACGGGVATLQSGKCICFGGIRVSDCPYPHVEELQRSS